MLSRPGLLLNPWALEETSTALAMGGGAGGKFGGRGAGPSGPGTPAPSAEPSQTPINPGAAANLDFLASPGRWIANLRPNGEGVVTVARNDLGDGCIVHALAITPEHTAAATLTLTEAPLTTRERRLARPLDTEVSFAQQQRIRFVDEGQAAALQGTTGARAETYDSLEAVFRLFASLRGDESDLQKFAFLLQWPELSDADKQAKYSEHACHELHFFLHAKDRPFFDRVIRPYLAHKASKTFLDEWLLERDLSRHLEPRAFAQLNILEKILLARRIGGASASIQRLVGEGFELIPVDVERQTALFTTALQAGSLAELSDIRAGLRTLMEAHREEDKSLDRAVRGIRFAAKSAAPTLSNESVVIDEEDEAAEKAGEDLFMGGARKRVAQTRGRRREQRQLYRAPDPTRRYVEHNYWHRRIEEQNADLIQVNGFWNDYARARAGEPFRSTHLAEATHHTNEMLMALAVLDLPFQSSDHQVEANGDQLTIRAASPLLLVSQEIVEAPRADDAAPILVSQHFFRLDEPYRFEGNQRRDAYVRGEFLIDVGYACRVVVTNPTSAPRRLDLLLQVPQGAMAIQRGLATKGQTIELAGYATQSIDYAFYFPTAGEFAHYPVHVAENGAIVASANAERLTAVPVLSQVDETSWQYVSQQADRPTLLRYLDGANLQRLDLDKIAWRMRDRATFDAVLQQLRQRFHYHPALWSYGIFHRDADTTREFLPHADGFLAQCGPVLRSPARRHRPGGAPAVSAHRLRAIVQSAGAPVRPRQRHPER